MVSVREVVDRQPLPPEYLLGGLAFHRKIRDRTGDGSRRSEGLHESLDGGGTVSLRLDAQGKTLAHALLAMEVKAPQALLDAARRGDQADRSPPKRSR